MNTEDHGLNSIDVRINDRGFFERILKEREALEQEREKTELERFGRIMDRLERLDQEIALQAKEYERRLHDLNGEYARDRARQNDYVTIDKYEDKLKAEEQARVAALFRVDEKFEEYVKRYEARQREVDLLLAAQAGAAEEAKRAVEEQGRKSDAQSRELARRQSRNLGLASLTLGLVVFLANILPVIFK